MMKAIEKFKVPLEERLAAKGLQKIESALFVKDVRRIIKDFPEMNLTTIKERLHLLGWRDDSGDYTTIQLILACYEDD